MNSTVSAPLRDPRDVTGVNPLRARGRIRGLLHRELLAAADLIVPIAVQPDHRAADQFVDLPTAVSISRLPGYVDQLRRVGVRSCKLFCYVEQKTPNAEVALRPDNLMATAIRSIRERRLTW